MRRLALLLVLLLGLSQPAFADEDPLDALFEALKTAEAGAWEGIEQQIWERWSHSGSASMDYLLERGRRAMSDDDPVAAIEHLTALVENAPDFAEGWNTRATAYYRAELVGPALADIARTLALEPRHFGALSGLGLILEESGDTQGALRAYEAALAIHPHQPDLREAVDRLEDELQGEPI